VNEREIVNILKKQRLDQARPWKAISSDYLTTREFLSLVGIEGRGREYRQTLLYLEIASRRDNANHLLPDYLKKCFRDGSVRVHVFRSRSAGLIGVEYRVPVDSLDKRYGERAKELIASRNGKTPDSVISRRTLKKLRQLSEIKRKSISELIDAWVDREMDAALGKEGGPPFGIVR
jgi:hypothetical protein